METRRKPNLSPVRPRVNALSPLQAFSPLADDRFTRSPLSEKGSMSNNSDRDLSRSNSMAQLQRSLSGRERVFSSHSRRPSGGSEVSFGGGGITTRLILVKAPNEEEGSPLRQRSKSSSNLVPFSSAEASKNIPATADRPRRSFAAASFASFTSMGIPKVSSPASENGPGLLRQDSVHSRRGSLVHLNTAADGPQKQLSPEEVIDLARGLMSPVAAPEEGSPEQAKLRRRKSMGHLKSPEKEPIALEPVDYVEMDDNSLLPFADRPHQVAELLANERNEPLMALLEQAFPKGALRPHWKDIDVTEWNWSEFYRLITTVTRRECPDYEWVLLAREAVRAHSVALWEKFGMCLGCDSELLTAGDEEETPASWAGLGLGEEGEYDPSLSRVFIEGLEPVATPDEKGASGLSLDLGPPTPRAEEDESSWNSMASSMGTIGESDEPLVTQRTRAADAMDPYGDIASRRGTQLHDSALTNSSPGSSPVSNFSHPGSPDIRKRTKSFVGLQILTSPLSPTTPLRSPSQHFTAGITAEPHQYDRGPGNPLFVSSFNTLSLGPNLGRKATLAADGTDMRVFPGHQFDVSPRSTSRPLMRKTSGAGLSESAITFVSDSSVDFP